MPGRVGPIELLANRWNCGPIGILGVREDIADQIWGESGSERSVTRQHQSGRLHPGSCNLGRRREWLSFGVAGSLKTPETVEE